MPFVLTIGMDNKHTTKGSNMHYEIWTTRFEDLGAELTGTYRAGESLSIADDVETVEIVCVEKDISHKYWRDCFGSELMECPQD